MPALALASPHRRWLALILLASVSLNAYGISFGLPYRWNVDETVATALKVGAQRSLIRGDTHQPHFHTYLLAVWLAPYALYVASTHPQADALKAAAAVSWNRFADHAPDVASTLYRIARWSSVLLGVLTVWLVYRFGTLLWDRRTGLLAASLLAFTQGFVGTNHFARSEPLVNLLGALTLYLLARSFTRPAHARRDVWRAAFVAGLAFSTKFNGLILAGSLALAFAWHAWRSRTFRWSWLAGGAGLYLLGLLVGNPTWPELLTQRGEVAHYWSLYFAGGTTLLGFAANAANYLIQLVVIFGVPFSLFIAGGLLHRRRDADTDGVVAGRRLVLATCAGYFLATCTYPFPMPLIKFISFIVPLLALFGGCALAAFVSAQHPAPAWRIAAAGVVFGYSSLYAFSVDVLLAKEDVRYATTRWIETHIPSGASIEHVQEEAWLYSPRLVSAYDIVYFGRRSQTHPGSLFEQAGEAGKPWPAFKEEYLARLTEERPQADYFLLWLEDPSELQGARPKAGPHERFLRRMVSGELGYRLIQRFQSRNYRRPLARGSRIYVPKSFWWHPVVDYVPAEIHVYQRIGSVMAREAPS